MDLFNKKELAKSVYNWRRYRVTSKNIQTGQMEYRLLFLKKENILTILSKSNVVDDKYLKKNPKKNEYINILKFENMCV